MEDAIEWVWKEAFVVCFEVILRILLNYGEIAEYFSSFLAANSPTDSKMRYVSRKV
jgi:hypothetical protein